MIVRRLMDVADGPNAVITDKWTSRRLLLERDGMGFSLHDTVIAAGASLPMHYKNHLEAVYCIDGKGSISDRSTGETFSIQPGTVYALNAHDKHILFAETKLRLVCVFNPPLTGQEVHDEHGAYPLLDAFDAAGE